MRDPSQIQPAISIENGERRDAESVALLNKEGESISIDP
jgi:hypothetical protein